MRDGGGEGKVEKEGKKDLRKKRRIKRDENIRSDGRDGQRKDRENRTGWKQEEREIKVKRKERE